MATPFPIVTAIRTKKLTQYRDTLFLTAQELKALKIANARFFSRSRLPHVKFQIYGAVSKTILFASPHPHSGGSLLNTNRRFAEREFCAMANLLHGEVYLLFNGAGLYN